VSPNAGLPPVQGPAPPPQLQQQPQQQQPQTAPSPQQAPAPQQPLVQQAPPGAQPPAPATQCGFPDAIGVTGGSVSSVGGQGGSFTATSTPVVLSTGSLVNCGQHYQLGFTAGGGGYGYDCKMAGFQYDISRYVQTGDLVSVYMKLPPNPCG
jgi:hypothetical protein